MRTRRALSGKVTSMDVILDTNIYMRDLKMSGNAFTELIAFLRRTDSRLVVPMLVFDEMSERYRDQLSEKLHKAERAWSEVRKTAMSKIPDFRGPDVNAEVRALKDRLRKPAKDVKAIMYKDLSGVDLQEVIRRGIKRIRPASDKGEELRDVVLWFIVLQYAKQTGDGVCFISDDRTFADTNGEDLHPDLLADIVAAGVNIRFFKEISHFIAANALGTKPLDEEWFLQFFTRQVIEEIAKKHLMQLRLGLNGVRNVEIRSLVFTTGQKYEVGKNAFYTELAYSGGAVVEVRESEFRRYPEILPSELAFARRGLGGGFLQPGGFARGHLGLGSTFGTHPAGFPSHCGVSGI